MNNSYQILSLLWALFVLFGYGFAGGPNTSTPMPLIEIVGFFVLAFVNFIRLNKATGYVLIVLILSSMVYAIYYKLQSPYLGWNDVKNRYTVPLVILIFSIFSIWKARPESGKTSNEVVE